MHCFLHNITVFIENGMLLSEFDHFSTARVYSAEKTLKRENAGNLFFVLLSIKSKLKGMNKSQILYFIAS